MEPAPDKAPTAEERVMLAFFEPLQRMQTTLSVLCEGQNAQHADPVTHTVLAMITAPVHVQLTAVGWQPFKGKELTYPYQMMSLEQKQVLKDLLTGEQNQQHWNVYEHAIAYRQRAPLTHLKPANVLEAMCTTILKSVAYADRRVRVAVCNILLQRVQVSIKVDKIALRTLNARLFPPPESHAD
jgi:hypothetical protein